MKRIIALCLSLMLLLSLASVASAAEGGMTIAVSLNSSDQYRTLWLEKITELATQKGYTVNSTNADNDPSKQISDVEALMQGAPDVLMVTPIDSEGIVPAIEAANAANVPVIGIDNTAATEVTTWLYDAQGLNGTIQADYLKAWLDEDPARVANVGYIVGMYSMEAAMPRMYDFQAAFEGDARFNWLAEADANWSADNAMRITEDWLQAHPDMNVFACMSDEIAIGCIQALKAAGKNMDEVIVMGVDGSAVAMEYLLSGDLDCTAARDVDKEVAFAIEIAEKIVAGEAVEAESHPMAIYPMSKEEVQAAAAGTPAE